MKLRRRRYWQFKANLSDIAVLWTWIADNSKPFYHVYGGSRTRQPWRTHFVPGSRNGAANSDRFVTNGGAGEGTVLFRHTDPQDPDTVYAESQNGGLGADDRKDRRSGPTCVPLKGARKIRCVGNWDAPFIISPHFPTRGSTFGANRLFRSDDRGKHLARVSPDVTKAVGPECAGG